VTTTSPQPRSPGHRLADTVAGRVLRLPDAPGDYAVARDQRIPARDGVELLADVYLPAGRSRGTVLLRSPYGAARPVAAVMAAPYATRGYTVVRARTRGTFGSGGTFVPMSTEVDDGADTVAWLREQPWFGGRFATVGASYLGLTQWALLTDPPPELVAAVVMVGPHDLSRAVYDGGAFNLEGFLAWADTVARQEEQGLLGGLLRRGAAARRQSAALRHLPVADAAEAPTGGRTPWFRDWATRRDLTDPWWSSAQLGAALDRVGVPVLLSGGWQDPYLPQTLEQYARLRERGVDVALTVGPWTHGDVLGKAAPLLTREALAWLDEHLGGGRPARPTPVRVHVTGAGEWRGLPSWPPATTEWVLHPQPGGALGEGPAAPGKPARFTFDPAEPTPSVGGRVATAAGGYADDHALLQRPDVLAFTGAPLAAPREVHGRPVVELAHTADHPHADLFVRVSEVDPRGRSRNVSDGFRRLDTANGVVRLELDAVAHRFAAGARIRLLVAGGAFPHWERDLGPGADPATATAGTPTGHAVDLAGSRLVLPVAEEE
jgi:putative CocE/NonD family hydrolase